MVIGVKGLAMEEEGRESEEREEGLMSVRLKAGDDTWIVVGVYTNGEMERRRRSLRRWMERQREGETITVGEDFNAKTGEGGGRVRGEDREQNKRILKDRTVNGYGKKLLELVQEVGWEISNENVEGDDE